MENEPIELRKENVILHRDENIESEPRKENIGTEIYFLNEPFNNKNLYSNENVIEMLNLPNEENVFFDDENIEIDPLNLHRDENTENTKNTENENIEREIGKTNYKRLLKVFEENRAKKCRVSAPAKQNKSKAGSSVASISSPAPMASNIPTTCPAPKCQKKYKMLACLKNHVNAHHPDFALETNPIYIAFAKQCKELENQVKDVDTKVEENIKQTKINTCEIEITRRMEKARVSIKDAQTEDTFKIVYIIRLRGFHERGYVPTYIINPKLILEEKIFLKIIDMIHQMFPDFDVSQIVNTEAYPRNILFDTFDVHFKSETHAWELYDLLNKYCSTQEGKTFEFLTDRSTQVRMKIMNVFGTVILRQNEPEPANFAVGLVKFIPYLYIIKENITYTYDFIEAYIKCKELLKVEDFADARILALKLGFKDLREFIVLEN